jgi:uncharacterized protein (TIGR00661 family)
VYPEDIRDKTVIVAPLDWGMGHATRCISLIKQLLRQKNKVVFAGTNIQVELLSKDFPEIIAEIIAGYNVTLDSHKPTYLQMIRQFGKLRQIVHKESSIAKRLVEKYHADIVVSDNRYGFLTNSTMNVIITHQLQVPVPMLKEFVNKRIRKHIESFDYCWVPDEEKSPICGEMIQPKLKIPKIFIGHLNRFENLDLEKEFDYLFLISGPEPERTHFTNHLLNLSEGNKRCCFVAPFPVNHLNYLINPSTAELNHLINKSEVVVSRAGYTTIMEMIALNKKAVLIPTKGQYEQEYLANIVAAENLDFKDLDDLVL